MTSTAGGVVASVQAIHSAVVQALAGIEADPACDWEDIEEEARRAGIGGFIPKPLFKSTLYWALNRLRDGGTAAEAEAPDEEKPSLEGLRVLLAEDQPIARINSDPVRRGGVQSRKQAASIPASTLKAGTSQVQGMAGCGREAEGVLRSAELLLLSDPSCVPA